MSERMSNVMIVVTMVVAMLVDLYAGFVAYTTDSGVTWQNDPSFWVLRGLEAALLGTFSLVLAKQVHKFSHRPRPMDKFTAVFFVLLSFITLIFNGLNNSAVVTAMYHAVPGASYPLDIGNIHIGDIYRVLLTWFFPCVLFCFAFIEPAKEQKTPAQIRQEAEIRAAQADADLYIEQFVKPKQAQVAALRGQNVAGGAMAGITGIAQGFGIKVPQRQIAAPVVAALEPPIPDDDAAGEADEAEAETADGEITVALFLRRLIAGKYRSRGRTVISRANGHKTIRSWLKPGSTNYLPSHSATITSKGRRIRVIVIAESDILAHANQDLVRAYQAGLAKETIQLVS